MTRLDLIPPLLGDGTTVRQLCAILGVDRRTVGRDLAKLYRAGRVRILPVRGVYGRDLWVEA